MPQTASISNSKKKKSDVTSYVTLEEYFKKEEKSLHKHEYHDGIIIPTAGAKLRHNRLASRTVQQLENFVERNQLGFIISNSDTKVRIEEYNKVVCPDALVICDTPQYFEGREDTITNPIIVVEVLSASSKKYERTTKFEMYRTLPSFKEYVLIYQDRRHIAVWTKKEDGSWLPQDYIGEEAMAILHALHDCPISLARLYKGL